MLLSLAYQNPTPHFVVSYDTDIRDLIVIDDVIYIAEANVIKKVGTNGSFLGELEVSLPFDSFRGMGISCDCKKWAVMGGSSTRAGVVILDREEKITKFVDTSPNYYYSLTFLNDTSILMVIAEKQGYINRFGEVVAITLHEVSRAYYLTSDCAGSAYVIDNMNSPFVVKKYNGSNFEFLATMTMGEPYKNFGDLIVDGSGSLLSCSFSEENGLLRWDSTGVFQGRLMDDIILSYQKRVAMNDKYLVVWHGQREENLTVIRLH